MAPISEPRAATPEVHASAMREIILLICARGMAATAFASAALLMPAR